uniref:USP domain-containing protein n=1 Tax=Panagrolaimus sp. PS1159 TaxID=55785 RepID=A0AC35F7E9_9BILA
MDVDESDDDSLNDDGKSDDSMNGRESDNEDEQLDDTEVEEFNYDSPQKTKLAVNNAEYFYGSVPMVFPEAGVIIAVNLADVQEKYGLKTESDAMSEMRTDGYCWHFQGKYTNQDTKITRSYWYAKDDKGDPTKSFQRYQFVYKNRYMLLHYIGNELYASDGLPHGNAVRKTNAYRKTRKSSLLKMLKASKKTLPNRTWELWKKSGGDLGLVTDPRDKEQLKNRRRLVQRISRFGKNTLFNLSILGSELLKPVILAAYLHDRKARPGHRFFFDEIYRNYERFFKKIKGRFLLVTDAEFNFLHCWIYLNHVHCYRHQKQAKCKQIVKCLKLLDDVQDQETTEECDEAIAKAMAEIPSGEDRLIFAKIANKVKESSRAGLLRQYGSTERKLTSNIAEIVNSLIKSKKKKKSVEADEMVCLLFYTTNNYHRDILRGYYGEGDFSLLPAFGNKKLGSPKMLKEIQLPWAPSPDGICDFLRNESQLPWDNSMKMERPLTLKDDQRKSSITTIVAQDIVETGDVHNPAPGYFLVIDKARKCHAVKLNSKNLDDYNLYLKLDPTVIPDFGEGDAVEDRRKRRPSTQGGPGFKQPRLVDKKDERDAEKEDDNNNEDDKNGHKKDSKSGKKVKSKAQEEENRRKAAALIDDENEQTEKAVKTNYLADKFPPPPQLPESSYPSWWNRLAVTVENILFHFEIFLSTFERPLKNLPVGKACIFQSHKEKFVLIYRKGNDEITAYVASHLLDPDSVKEIAFTAAQCFRDASSSTVNVRGFYADNSEQNDNPLFLLLLKLHVLKENENPEEYAFNFTYFDDEFTEESINQLLNNKKSVNPAINEFEKIEKVELLCCCKRAYFRCSELRSKALKLQQTIKCDTCNKEYFQRCVNASERASTFWSCYSCSVAPVLPKWGGKRVTNTCPVDNFLAAFIIMQTKFPKFTDVIRNRKSCNNYEDEICYFLDDCLTASNAKDLTNKKEEFILRNYSTRTKDKNKINLWGSEHSVFFENLFSTCGVIVDFECDECGNKATNESPRFHTYF